MLQAKQTQLTDWHEERLNDARLLSQRRVLREGWDSWREAPDAPPPLAMRHALEQVLEHGRYRAAGIVDGQGHALWVGAAPPDPQGLIPQAATRVLDTGSTARAWIDADGRWQWIFVINLAGMTHPAALVLAFDDVSTLPALQPWQDAPTGDIATALARRDGDRVLVLDVTRPKASAVIPLEAGDHPAVRMVLRTAPPERPLSARDPVAGEVAVVGQPVLDGTWHLLIWQPVAQIRAAALRGAETTLLAALLAIFGTVVGVRLFDERARLAQVQTHAAALREVSDRLADSERRYRLLAEHSADVVWLYDLQQDRFLYVSPSVQRLIGHGAQDIVGRSFDTVLTPASLAHVRERLPQRLGELARGQTSALIETTELDLLHLDGHPVYTETVSTLITGPDGRAVQLQGVTRDLTARREAETYIRLLSQAVEQSPAAVLITDAQARIEYVNPAFERISGYTLAQVRGHNPRLLSSGRMPAETWQLDISAQRDAEAKAHQLAWFDPLTGLPNRARTLDRLEQVLAGDRRHQRHRALLLLNIDRFKTFNEALGHASGDVLLQQLAQRLRAAAPRADLLARLGGDEFALLTPGVDGGPLAASRAAQDVSERIHTALQDAFTLDCAQAWADAGSAGDTAPVNITLSIGIAVLPADGDDTPLDVLRRADTALRRAKERGGHQSVFFDDAMGAAVARRFTIEQELRRALAADELRLYLQPQADAQGHWRAAEALVRWQHPVRGLVPPAEFVPVAEGCDLIEPLGHWVLQAACTHLGQLARAGTRLPIAVNVSPRQFHRPHFVQEVLDALRTHGAAATDLVLEVTEGVVVEDIDAVIERMLALTREGVRFSIDDFGTGYSSLSYLKRLPIQEIKIDRSFVHDAPNDPDDAALVEAIVAVAERLRLRVVAEGVETAEQAAFFGRWPHVLQQGYLHGRPEAAESVLARWRAAQADETAADSGGMA
ncbi:putative bifunctional diguanylate cyclase/phosphodiesterase [Tepidimonas sp.]|uniref:putative bifunctional diguanylate cyclase/phosphodiesterase n=1 Tax=Tepidimonas sp. TaxID=2002775 RepID=UPI003918E995